MNAYKLADELQKLFLGEEYDRLVHEIPDVLRQQADRIAELEKCIEFGYKDAMDIVVLNNLGAEDNHWFVWAKKLVNIDYTAPKPIEKPLYTAPQTKPLSDSELIVFLMDDIDKTSQWLVEGQTHMAIGVLGQCHAEIRKHLGKKSKPLSDEEIIAVFESPFHPKATGKIDDEVIAFARAIEERHGIK